MSWGKVEPVSRIVLAFSATAAFLLAPLSDSLHPTFAGPSTIRVLAILLAVGKGCNTVWCKTSVQRCHAYYHDYNWTVTTTANSTSYDMSSNSTISVTEHELFSTLNVMESCDFIIVILSLQVCIQSLTMR